MFPLEALFGGQPQRPAASRRSATARPVPQTPFGYGDVDDYTPFRRAPQQRAPANNIGGLFTDPFGYTQVDPRLTARRQAQQQAQQAALLQQLQQEALLQKQQQQLQQQALAKRRQQQQAAAAAAARAHEVPTIAPHVFADEHPAEYNFFLNIPEAEPKDMNVTVERGPDGKSKQLRVAMNRYTTLHGQRVLRDHILKVIPLHDDAIVDKIEVQYDDDTLDIRVPRDRSTEKDSKTILTVQPRPADAPKRTPSLTAQQSAALAPKPVPQQEAARPVETPATPDLTKGWMVQLDRTGRPVFIHPATGRVQYNLPLQARPGAVPQRGNNPFAIEANADDDDEENPDEENDDEDDDEECVRDEETPEESRLMDQRLRALQQRELLEYALRQQAAEAAKRKADQAAALAAAQKARKEAVEAKQATVRDPDNAGAKLRAEQAAAKAQAAATNLPHVQRLQEQACKFRSPLLTEVFGPEMFQPTLGTPGVKRAKGADTILEEALEEVSHPKPTQADGSPDAPKETSSATASPKSATAEHEPSLNIEPATKKPKIVVNDTDHDHHHPISMATPMEDLKKKLQSKLVEIDEEYSVKQAMLNSEKRLKKVSVECELLQQQYGTLAFTRKPLGDHPDDIQQCKEIDKARKYIDEMLTQQLIELDNVDACGDADIRHARKELVVRVQRFFDAVERFTKAERDGAPQPGDTANEVAEGGADAGIDTLEELHEFHSDDDEILVQAALEGMKAKKVNKAATAAPESDK